MTILRRYSVMCDRCRSKLWIDASTAREARRYARRKYGWKRVIRKEDGRSYGYDYCLSCLGKEAA